MEFITLVVPLFPLNTVGVKLKDPSLSDLALTEQSLFPLACSIARKFTNEKTFSGNCYQVDIISVTIRQVVSKVGCYARKNSAGLSSCWDLNELIGRADMGNHYVRQGRSLGALAMNAPL
jgi:hypothetical protein